MITIWRILQKEVGKAEKKKKRKMKMNKQSKESTWDRFSQGGVFLAGLYVALLILGILVRLMFFSEAQNTSIVPENDTIAAADIVTTVADAEQTTLVL